ncbi:O-antigen ligase [Methylophilus sp. Leaf414]|uniref:O-antigen ligase family protein n=1 Tax=Methylophilus sp. Leaf414 TaxID=1736371 RepID=UPI0006FBFFDE|nr:O-antigen ligase family protein [Methylophilus sp. Leaf414]KQT34473.1 hypothetical protein ASG24_12245 [Methylophilus sp. Leaf414]
MTSKSKVALFLFASIAAIFFGLASLMMLNLAGQHYNYLLSLPLFFVIAILFFLDRQLFFLLIILTRASLDAPLDSIKLGTFGLGAVLNALVIIIAFLAILEKKPKLTNDLDWVKKSWAIFLILSFISLFYAPKLLPSVKVFLLYVSYSSMLYLGLYLVKSENDFGKWMKAIFYSSVIPVTYGLYCLAFGGQGGLRLSVEEGLRLQSTFNHPNSFSFYLVLIITITFYIYKTKPSYFNTTVLKVLPIYIITLLGLLLMTKTRAAWAACGLFFLLYGLIFERKFLIVLFFASFLALLIPDVQHRLLDLQQGTNWGATGYERLNSYAWRIKYWTDALHWMSVKHYIQGYGLHSFTHFSTSFGMGNAHHLQTVEINAHSVYVLLFFELGILGLLAFLFIIFSHLKALIKIYSYNKFLVFTVIVVLVEFLFECYSDNMLDYLNFDWYLWFLIGLTLSYVNLSKNPSKYKNV